MTNPRSGGRVGVACALAATALAACSLIVDTNADPCRSDGDCPRPGTVCGPERVCVAPPDAGAPDVDAPDALACTEESCCSAAQCMSIHGGEPYACPRPGKACVPLKTEACQRLIGKYDDPNALVIGIFGVLSGDQAPTTQAMVDIADLAFSELNVATLGIPGASGSAARPIAAVVCDQLVDVPATHLIDELHVPAILAVGSSGYTVAITPRLVASDTFCLCAVCGSPALTTLDDHGLVWRTEPVLSDLAPAMAAYFPELEANVRSADGIPSAPIKVAVLSSRAFIYSSATDKFIAGLQFNGKDPLANGANFFRIDYDDPTATTNIDFQAIAEQIVAYGPQIIVVSGNEELPGTVMPAIDAAWGGSPRPYYLGHAGLSTQSLYSYVAADPTRRQRLRLFDFVIPEESAAAYAAYAIREHSRYPGQDPNANQNVYDATYATLYAIAAVDPTLALTGSRIAAQVPRLAPPAATKIAIGPSDLPSGISILRGGASIDLIGVFTDMNFDAVGDVHGDSALICLAPVSSPVDSGAPTYAEYFTKRVYTTATGQLSGTDDCPP
jgi:hypothetical protein